MIRPALLVLFLFLQVQCLYPQIPPGYYDDAEGKTGTELQIALHNIIKGHLPVSYSSLPAWFQQTDIKPDNTVWDMYSDVPGGTPPYVYHFGEDECGNYSGEGDCFNREHSWPKSWFGGEVMPMYSDMFQLYPTDGYVNNRRDNYPYGEVATATWTSQNGSKLGACITQGYSGTVFEPIDEYKGDFARSYFYMSTRYFTEDAGWPGSPMTTGSQLKPWALTMMLEWNSEDPVSEKETNRNNVVYGIQANRNPFIDNPGYAGSIWGFPAGINESKLTLRIYPNPATDHCYLSISSGEITHVTVIDMLGVNYPVKTMQRQNALRMDLSELAPGIYAIILNGNTTALRGMVIVH